MSVLRMTKAVIPRHPELWQQFIYGLPRGKQSHLVMFADSHGGNIPTMADFKLQGDVTERRAETTRTVGSSKLAEAGSCTPWKGHVNNNVSVKINILFRGKPLKEVKKKALRKPEAF